MQRLSVFAIPVLMILAGCAPTIARAGEGPLTLAASARLRVESIANQFRPDAPFNDTMVSLKTAVEANYDTGPVEFGAELWDARAWGQDIRSSAGTSEVNALELVQAHAKIRFGGKAGAGHGTLTAGRFTLDLGGRRLVSRQRFRNTTNAFTGAHLVWRNGAGRQFDAIWTMPQVRLPDDAAGIRADRVVWDQESTDLMFFGGQATLPTVLGGVVQPYAYGLIERDSPDRLTRNRRLATIGVRLFRVPSAGNADHDIEMAYQSGKARRSTQAVDIADLDVAAWFIHAEVGQTLGGGWKPRLVAMFDAASSDRGQAGKFTRFDTLYGARRFEFGPNGLYGPFSRANMISPAARLEVTPSKRSDAFIAWRSAWAHDTRDTFAATGVRDAGGAAGRLAGHQIEARLRYWIMPGRLQVDAGGAVLIKRGFLRDAPVAPATGNTRYGYIDMLLML